MEVEVFVHPTCSTCHSLIRLLKQWGFIDKVKIYDTSIDPHAALERGVRSVPSIFIDGDLVFAGVVDFKRLKSILDTGLHTERVMLSDEELIERFLRGVLDSVATALWLYINVNCRAFTNDVKFLKAITNLSTYSDGNLNRLVDILKNDGNCRSIVENNKERFLRVIATNFTREVYWLNGKVNGTDVLGNYNLQSIAHWAMVRGSVSRVGLVPHSLNDDEFRGKIEELWSYIKAHFDELMSRVASEQEELRGDSDWVLRS
ncbi:thioredoxin family protein [Caldivirga maquilingensis]|uniref:Glutaredoxin n=1 Tax=Caldivirga maquilingensis (strain ATCC 700844 / DSM 13496 / JCM 10307 / IC-167) TaxID=397948 RepID=A8MAS4_CALMQ|nr:thioredoxin family protein [Caldivirga maquilingensis]ABW01110.1 glutaredoxin [Caldivirga maquilingensis IC-167]